MPVVADDAHELLVKPSDVLAPLLLMVFDESDHIFEDLFHGLGYFIEFVGIFFAEILFELLIDLLGMFFLHRRISVYSCNILESFKV